jgi:ferredoxin-NADP reductase
VHSTDVDTLVVTGKRAAADGVVELVLAHPDGERLPDWAPGRTSI